MNKKQQVLGRTGAPTSPAIKTSLPPTKSYNSEHTLPSPILSNKDFDFIPGIYVKKNFHFKKFGGQSYDYE